MTKVIVILDESNCSCGIIEAVPDNLFFVPLPLNIEEYHKEYLMRALELNLGIELQKNYKIEIEKSYLFLKPENENFRSN